MTDIGWPQRLLNAVHRAVVITALLGTVLLGVHHFGSVDADHAPHNIQIEVTS